MRRLGPVTRAVGPRTTIGGGGTTLAVLGTAALLLPAAMAAQSAQRGNCTLIWEPTTADTRSVSIREGEDAHVTHVSGGMLWKCGTATMRADSAVKYDLARRVDLIGNVRYRDTIRTLESLYLTYFELDDRVIATDSVHLTRLGDGSTLTGPRVEFLRAVTGVDEETIATGRPHMVLYPEGDDPGPPFDVDADRAVFAGEEEARAFGNVIISRPDLRSEADSATFRIPEGSGVLYGSPWVEAEDITLHGDTIRTSFEDNVLRNVHALGNAHAQGESFEVRSERIDVSVEDDEVEAVWAHGEGAAEAISGDQHLYGDSLRFAMFEGRLDTINAVGGAAAVQGTGPARFDLETPPGTEAGEGLPLTPAEDSIQVPEMVAEESMPAPEPAAGDSVDAAEPIAEDSIRTPDAVTEDSIQVPEMVAEDSMPAPEPVAGDSVDAAEAIAEDSVPATGRSPPDSAEAATPPENPGQIEAPAETRAERDVSGRPEPDTTSRARSPGSVAGPRLRLPTDDDSNWVTGDTLYAIFERASSGVGRTLPDAVEPVRIPPDSAVATPIPPDSAIAEPLQADSTADPVLERLTVIGHARSLYAQVRDSAETTRPSRNYMIGARIDIFFRDGEPERVEGTDAIGLYLEPIDTPESSGRATGALPVPGDTLRAREDTTDVGARGDTTRIRSPPDSIGSARIPQRSGGASPSASASILLALADRRRPLDARPGMLPRKRQPLELRGRWKKPGSAEARLARGSRGPKPSRNSQ